MNIVPKQVLMVTIILVWVIAAFLSFSLFYNPVKEVNDKIVGFQEEFTSNVMEMLSYSRNTLILRNLYSVNITELELFIDNERVPLSNYYLIDNNIIINFTADHLNPELDYEIKVVTNQGSSVTLISQLDVMKLNGELTDVICGDKFCAWGESCFIDCLVELYCDDGADNDENFFTDSQDIKCQACGNGKCESSEDCITCPADCLKAGEVCCNKTAVKGDCCTDNDCPQGHYCDSNTCKKVSYSCGDGLCFNETCADCPLDCLKAGEVCCNKTAVKGDCCTNNDCNETSYCNNNTCTPKSTLCGNKICDPFEDCESCPIDCLSNKSVCCNKVSVTGNCCNDNDCNNSYSCINNNCTLTCGDGRCQSTEDCSTCPADCLLTGHVCCNRESIKGNCCNDTMCGVGKICHLNTCYSNTTCFPQWNCFNWYSCTAEGIQYRDCIDVNSCNSLIGKPETNRTCTPLHSIKFLDYIYDPYNSRLNVTILNFGSEELMPGTVTLTMFNNSLGTGTYTTELIGGVGNNQAVNLTFIINKAHVRFNYTYSLNYLLPSSHAYSDNKYLFNHYSIEFKNYNYNPYLSVLNVSMNNKGSQAIKAGTIGISVYNQSLGTGTYSGTLNNDLLPGETKNVSFNVNSAHINFFYNYLINYSLTEGLMFNTRFNMTSPYKVTFSNYLFNPDNKELSIKIKNSGDSFIHEGQVSAVIYNNTYVSNPLTTTLINGLLKNQDGELIINTGDLIINYGSPYKINFTFPGGLLFTDTFTPQSPYQLQSLSYIVDLWELRLSINVNNTGRAIIPAGEVIITFSNQSRDPNIDFIKSLNGGVATLTNNLLPGESAQLIFDNTPLTFDITYSLNYSFNGLSFNNYLFKPQNKHSFTVYSYSYNSEYKELSFAIMNTGDEPFRIDELGLSINNQIYGSSGKLTTDLLNPIPVNGGVTVTFSVPDYTIDYYLEYDYTIIAKVSNAIHKGKFTIEPM